MTATPLETLKYPIGKFNYETPILANDISGWAESIATLPARLQVVLSSLTEIQMSLAYRKDGWTVSQVVHHLADSHANAYIRFHWALTENTPTIKPYLEAQWAELPYLTHTPISVSMAILEAIHQRWSILIKHLSDEDLEKAFIHPEYNRTIQLKQSIGAYAWHGNHHLAHITGLIDRNFEI